MLILLLLKIGCTLGNMVKRASSRKAAGNPSLLVSLHLGDCVKSAGHSNNTVNQGESENRDQFGEV